MKNKKTLFIVLLLTNFTFLPSILKAQSKDIIFKNVSSINLSDFDKLKPGEKHKWTSSDGNTYGIKNEDGKKSTWIELGGKMVLHGMVYIYEKTYDEPRIEYLREKTQYVYGQKHGISETYSIVKGKTYLKELATYAFGQKHGDYNRYESKNQIISTGQYDRGIKQGKWIDYYSSGNIMYEYDYNGLSGVRYSYSNGGGTANSKKGKLQSKSNYKLFFNSGDKKGRWERHGLSTYYNYDGSIKEKYFYKGKESDKGKQIEMSDEVSLKQSGNNRENNDDIIINSELHNSSNCASSAKEIKELLSRIKPTSNYARETKRIGNEICAYLVSKEVEKIPWYSIQNAINLITNYLREETKRKCDEEECRKRILFLKQAKSYLTGVRG